ncbi:MAG: hypothetical protein Kow0031_15180 [Anaerolineae bacterium]
MPLRKNQPILLLGVIFLAGNGLLLAPDGSLLKGVGALLVLLLPGLVIAQLLRLGDDWLFRGGVGLGLSYALMILLGMLLHYWPGPITGWMVAGLFNLMSLCGLGWLGAKSRPEEMNGPPGWVKLSLAAILLVASGLYFINLGYSEFDGDETKALFPAAEAIEGRADALFYQRKKGPGEILPPMLVWRLTTLINEPVARLPFAVAGLLVIWLMFLLGRDAFGEAEGLLAAFLLALSGLMVAFARIVQYQQLVMMMSLLALLAIWRWRADGRAWWWPLAGLFLGAGLLSHYDAVLVTPALAYAAVSSRKAGLPRWDNLLAGGGVLAGMVGLFAVPYWLTASTGRTGNYLEERIGGGLLKNQLANFFHVNSFYSSFYTVALISLLALLFLALALARYPGVRDWRGSRTWVPALVVIGSLAVTVWPVGAVPALLWFGVIFAGAMISPGMTPAGRTVTVWLATTFIGYNFFVATPRTHVYTILPPLTLLAASAALILSRRVPLKPVWGLVPAAGLLLLSGGYLTHAFLRPAVQFEVDWPASRLPFYWSPFAEAPDYDAYGFMHRSGWKAVGGLYLAGQLAGDYQTNGLTELAAWYTRHQLQGCYRQSSQFFGVAHRLIDPQEFSDYQLAGKVELAAGQGMAIYQPRATWQPLPDIAPTTLEKAFDGSATAPAFVRPGQLTVDSNFNFADAALLRGFEITPAVARPGQQVAVRLSWQVQRSLPIDADVFVHLEDEPAPGVGAPAVRAQSNGAPGCGQRPTSGWEVGEVIEDLHILTIPPETPPGRYLLKAGLYLPLENRRVPVLDEAGQPVADDAVSLATFTLEQN